MTSLFAEGVLVGILIAGMIFLGIEGTLLLFRLWRRYVSR
jgi:hypothetical protein